MIIIKQNKPVEAYDFPTAQGGQDMAMSTFSPIGLRSSNGMRMSVSQCMCVCVRMEWT